MTTSKYILSLILIFTLTGVAENKVFGFEITVKTGQSFGVIQKPKSNGTVDEIDYGGTPISLGFVNPLTQKVSLNTHYTLLYDPQNRGVLKSGPEAGFAWFLLGGPRHFVQGIPAGKMSLSSNRSLSVFALLGAWNYSASTDDLSLKISGSTFEARVGANVRQGKWGVEISSTISSWPSSEERLETTMTELMLTLYL